MSIASFASVIPLVSLAMSIVENSLSFIGFQLDGGSQTEAIHFAPVYSNTLILEESPTY